MFELESSDFHTIKSILNYAAIIILTIIYYDFHTIKSILNQAMKDSCMCYEEFPYY